MSKNSKILFLSFTLVLLLTAVGAVSAADTNNTDNSIVSEDNSISESMIQQEKIIKDKPVKDNVVKVDAKLEDKKAGSVKTSTNTETKNIKKTIPTNKDVTDYNTLKAAWDEIQADGDENTHYTINVKNGQYDFEDELKSNITNTRYIH